MAIVGYTRVSSADQNTARQLEGIALDRVFTDHASGKDVNRPQLIQAMLYLREGDTLKIHSMDRLARNLEDLRRTVTTLTAKGVTVLFVKENLTFTPEGTSPMSNLMLSIMGAFAQFERELLRERQKEGIAIAKAAGKYRGGQTKSTPEKTAAIRARLADGVSKAAVAREFKISRASLYKYLADSSVNNLANPANGRTLMQLEAHR